MLAKLDGTIIATGQGGPSDHFHIEGGVEKNRHAIHGSIEDVLIHAGADGGDVVAVGLGLTGAPREGDQNPVVKDLVQELLPHLGRDRIVVEPDDRTNLAGASGGKPGVVLIAGVAASRMASRAMVAKPFPVALATSSATRAAHSTSACGRSSQPARRATRAVPRPCWSRSSKAASRNRQDTGRLPVWSIAKGFSRARHLLTPSSVSAAASGDGEAVRILQESAQEVAATALGVIRQLHRPGEPASVYLTGGVFNAGALVLDPFTAALREGWPGLIPFRRGFLLSWER